jgi:putative endonuclease
MGGYSSIESDRMSDTDNTAYLASAESGGWYLYIIETERGKLYTGITTDVERRFEQHRSGKAGAKFFRTDPPLRICYRARFADRSQASREEYRIKQLSRQQKQLLIAAVANI